MANSDDPLEKFRGSLPSRAELSMLTLFGTSEAARAAAKALLKLLPPMTPKEKESWATDCWKVSILPPASDMAKSPIGLATLELLRANEPGTKKAEPAVNAPEPEPAAGAESNSETSEQLPDDGVNDSLKRLSWPPRPQQPPQPSPQTTESPDWIRHLDRPQITPWVDDSNNSPIY